MKELALKLNNVTKHFGAVKALTDINLEFGKGEIIGLIGSNGAGKSTLLNIIWGVFAQDSGELLINGQKVNKITPEKAHELGISIIFQHRRLMPYMTVAENIFIDNMPKKKSGFIDFEKMNRDATELLKMLDLDIDCKRNVAEFSAEERQLIEIVKACSRDPKILLMDEPTTALRQHEVDTLFKIMRNLKDKGCSVVFISHRLKEVMEVCDKISIIRDGRNIIQGPTSDFTADKIIDYMSGLKEKVNFEHFGDVSKESEKKFQHSDIFLSAKNIVMDNVNNVSFKVHKGEILGFAGLGGSGIDDLFANIYGLKNRDSGSISINGEETIIKHPRHAVAYGIGFVSEDRQLSGEFLNLSVSDNVCIPKGQKSGYFSTINYKKELEDTNGFIGKLSIKTESGATLIKNLSGGNQQKAIIAKWLQIKSQIILMSEPTAGIDVAAKAEVNNLIQEIAQEGKSILYTSSYINELMRVSDRIIVVYKSNIFKEFLRSEFDHNKIYLAMNGIIE